VSRQYARVYYDDIQAEFPQVYADDALLATWVRLLVLAEKMWPTLPEIPRSVRIKTYQRLVEAGLVIPSGEHCYRIRGLDAERTRRRDAARIGAAERWDSERNAIASAIAMPSTSTRREEDKNEDGRADLEAFLMVRRKAPTPRQRKLLDDILEHRDVSGPRWAADIILKNPDDPIGAVIEADKAWRAERIASANKVEAEHTKRKRDLPRWFDEYKAWVASGDEEPAA
jgi:hypothetical protein